jgi:hypothetical protein
MIVEPQPEGRLVVAFFITAQEGVLPAGKYGREPFTTPAAVDKETVAPGAR